MTIANSNPTIWMKLHTCVPLERPFLIKLGQKNICHIDFCLNSTNVIPINSDTMSMVHLSIVDCLNVLTPVQIQIAKGLHISKSKYLNRQVTLISWLRIRFQNCLHRFLSFDWYDLRVMPLTAILVASLSCRTRSMNPDMNAINVSIFVTDCGKICWSQSRWRISSRLPIVLKL